MADLYKENVWGIIKAKFDLDNTVQIKYAFIILQYVGSYIDSLMHGKPTCDE